MKYKQPKRTILEADEAERINNIRMAKYFQIDPRLIEDFPEQLYHDTLEILWFEDQVERDKAAKQRAAQARAKARRGKR